jgi:fatty-acyl-CoA synthase
LWLCVADDATACPPWAVSYESLTTTASSGHTRGPRGVSPDDQILLYTGGTTGMPKGVIWRQDDVFRFLNEASPEPYPDDGSLADVRAALVRRGGGGIQLSPSPLMHATGGWSACGALSRGGTSVLLAARRFDPVELLDTVDREQVTAMLLVGDAFAQPIAAALAATPARWNLQSLRVLASTGAALGATTRRLLIDLLPTTTQVMEGISSSEAVAIAGTKVTGDAEQVGHFRPAAGVRVIADDGRDVAAGSGEAGQIAVCRFVPLGYYKDPQRTARTIRVIDGRRYVLPGDYATVDADGSIRFIGRGTGCINSGGEKIFPQEVENVLLRHPSILEVAILGAPDERMGEAVTAVLRLRDGCHATDDELIAHVRSMLAHYKAPKRFLRLQELPRQPNGKPDYLRLRQYVLQQIQSSRSP